MEKKMKFYSQTSDKISFLIPIWCSIYQYLHILYKLCLIGDFIKYALFYYMYN